MIQVTNSISCNRSAMYVSGLLVSVVIVALISSLIRSDYSLLSQWHTALIYI